MRILKSLNIKLYLFIFILGASPPFSMAAGNTSPPLPKTVAECKQTRDSSGNKPGYMPEGASDENIRKYKQESCEANKGRPADEDSCEMLRDAKIKAAVDLNQFVSGNCEKMINDINRPDYIQCRSLRKAAEKNGEKINQSVCTKEANTTYENVQKIIKTHSTKSEELQKIIRAGQELQLSASNNTTNALKNMTDPKGKVNLEKPNNPDALLTGHRTAKDALNFHKNQDPKVAEAFLQKFSGLAAQTGDSKIQYVDRLHEIKNLESSLPEISSPMLREQFTNLIDSQKILLATEEINAELEKLEGPLKEFENKTFMAAGGLASIVPVSNEASVENKLDRASAKGGDSEANQTNPLGISESRPFLAKEMDDKRESAISAGKSAHTPSSKEVGKGSGDISNEIPSTTARIQRNSSLKDSLRQKLLSLGSSRNPSSHDSPSEKSPLPVAQNRGEEAAYAFENSGEQTGSSTASISNEQNNSAIKALLVEAQQSQNGAFYLGSETTTLFFRVKDKHTECLKHNCVDAEKNI